MTEVEIAKEVFHYRLVELDGLFHLERSPEVYNVGNIVANDPLREAVNIYSLLSDFSPSVNQLSCLHFFAREKYGTNKRSNRCGHWYL